MKFRKIYISFCMACAFCASATAQTARQVLDETAAKLKSSGGIEASFEGTTFKGVEENGSAKGHIYVQGNKFKISSENLTTWFDGRTQWTLLTGSDEVNVSTPTEAELQQINPYTFVDLYRKGYNLKLGHTQYQGKTCHEVRLISQNKSNQIQLLIAVIDKQTHMPVSIRIRDHRGEWSRIRVHGIRTNRRWNDATFKFDAKLYPGVEVIDLR